MYPLANSSQPPSLGEVQELSRGGYIVGLSIGVVQVGAPPETIKDTLLLQGGVPTYYCVSDVLFDWNRGLSYCELEFPVYYNYFLRNHKTSIVCTAEHEIAIRNLLTRGAFGMQNFSLVKDYAPEDQEKIFDILSELHYFREDRKLQDLVSIEVLERQTQTVRKETCSLHKTPGGDFLIRDQALNNKEIFVPGRPNLPLVWNQIPTTSNTPEMLHIPRWFSVLPLGTSHGFDPMGRTSGFLFWIQGRGVLVDPPAGSTVVLRELGIDARLIDSMILTHTHADHDSGILEKLLEEKKIHVYSTHSVFQIWLDKYRHMTGLSEGRLLDLVHFHSVYIGQSVEIHGAEFVFSYRLHSVPTIGFSVQYDGKKILYSGDHLNDPTVFLSLYNSGIIGKMRYEELSNFSWDADLIYHEAGVPPIHTRLDYLSALPVAVQKKIFAYHISESDFINNKSKMQQAKEQQLFCLVPEKKVGKKKIRDAMVIAQMSTADGWEEVPQDVMQKYFEEGTIESLDKGSTLFSVGEVPSKVTVIISGLVHVQNSLGINKIYGAGQTLALNSVCFQTPLQEIYRANTEVVLFQIDFEKVQNLMQNFPLGTHQNWAVWEMLQSSTFCKEMTYRQQSTILDSLQLIQFDSVVEIEEKNPLIGGVFLYGSGEILEGNISLQNKKVGFPIFSFWKWLEISQQSSPLRRVCVQPGGVVFGLSWEMLQYLYRQQPGILRRIWKEN